MSHLMPPSEGKTVAIIFTHSNQCDGCDWISFVSALHFGSWLQTARLRLSLWDVCQYGGSCSLIWLFSSVKTPVHRGKWIQSRHSLLVHMWWGEEMSFCWQLPKSHCTLIWLSALHRFANQLSPHHLHLAKQILAGIWLPPVLYQWAGMNLRQMWKNLQWCLSKTLPKLCYHYYSGEHSTAQSEKHVTFFPAWESVSLFHSLDVCSKH